MEHIAIKDKKVKIDIIKLLNIISLKKGFEIDLNGNLIIQNEEKKQTPIIFKSNENDNFRLLVDSKSLVSNIFKDYKPEINGTICVLNLVSAWQQIIDFNKSQMLYFDHQTDGVEIFEDETLEEYGWHCIPCDITYRQLSEFIESSCEGCLVFYDNEIQFNGFVIVKDIEDVRNKVYTFIINNLKDKLDNNKLDLDDDEVLESLQFFNIKV